MCRQKARLLAVLPLENCHQIALYRSASQFIFFERCLQSRTSLGVSAHDEPERVLWALWLACTRLEKMSASRCRSTRPVRHKSSARLGCGTELFNASTVKSQQPARFCRMTVSSSRAIQSTCLQTSTLFVSYCISQTQLVLRVTKLRAVHVWVSSTSGCSGVGSGSSQPTTKKSLKQSYTGAQLTVWPVWFWPETALWRLQISIFSGSMSLDLPSRYGLWPHLLWPD